MSPPPIYAWLSEVVSSLYFSYETCAVSIASFNVKGTDTVKKCIISTP